MIEVRPQPGPQEAFLGCEADIAIYGGAAFSGKTFAGIMSLAMGVHIPGYAAVAFRRTSPELTGGGSIWEESQKFYRALGGTSRTSKTLEWRFPSGAMIEFRHLQHEDDIYSHQGKQYAQILFDELTHFTEDQFWYLYGRARTTCGVRPFVRATCNPDPDSFVRQLIDWWIGDDGFAIPERSGVIRWFVRSNDGTLDWFNSRAECETAHPPKWNAQEQKWKGPKPTSLTFIPAKISDNPIGTASDPDYETKLEALSTVQRRRLRDGDWDSRLTAGSLFKREWFAKRMLDERDAEGRRFVRHVRAWDRAATEVSEANKDPDWTASVLWGLTDRNELIVRDVRDVRATPHGVWEFMRDTAATDPSGTTIALFQDPGSAGKSDDFTARRELIGYHIKTHPARIDKVAMAEVWSPLCERGIVHVQRAQWNERFFRQLEAFPTKGVHDDLVDAASLGVMELGLRPTGTHAPARQVAAVRPYESATDVRPVLSTWRGHGPLPKRY